MKKTIAWTMAALMAAGMMTGCGPKQAAEATTAAGTGAGQAESGQVQTAAQEGQGKPSGEVKVWMWENAKVAFDPLAEKFQEAYPDVKVVFETMPNDDLYKKYILTAQAGDGGPDVVIVEAEMLPTIIRTNSLLDVTDYIGEDASNFNPAKIQQATGKDGRIYAVPWDSSPSAMMYNRKIFKDAGLSDDPEEVAKLLHTWDGYKEVMQDIKDATGCYAFATQKTNVRPSHFVGMVGQKSDTEDAFMFNKNGDVMLDSAFNIRVAQFLTDMFDSGLVYDAQRYTQQHDQAYKDDKVATIFGAAWMTEVLKNAYGKDHLGNWGVVPMPVWDEGDAPTCEDGGSNLAISKTCKNVDAAWAFINFHLMNTESQIEMSKQGLFPSWQPAYGNPEVSKADEFFGGQNAIAVFEELAPLVPSVNYTEDFQRATDALKVALELCYNDKSKPVEVYMKDAADEIRSKTGRK